MIDAFDERIRFGVYSGPQHAAFSDCAELWRRCEALGYDWLSVFDHFMPIVGDPDGPCLEGPTMLAAMAAHTSRVRIAILVTGVTYRHPAVAANMAATIDHISGGRLEYGVGGGWMEDEHRQYGIPSPRIGVRMDMLDEACRMLRGLWTREGFSFAGRHYTLEMPAWSPSRCRAAAADRRRRGRAAHAADRRRACQRMEHGHGRGETFRHKLAVLGRHCEDVGRDPAEIRKSLTVRAVVAEDEAALRSAGAELARAAVGRGPVLFATPEQTRRADPAVRRARGRRLPARRLRAL